MYIIHMNINLFSGRRLNCSKDLLSHHIRKLFACGFFFSSLSFKFQPAH